MDTASNEISSLDLESLKCITGGDGNPFASQIEHSKNCAAWYESLRSGKQTAPDEFVRSCGEVYKAVKPGQMITSAYQTLNH